jgi:GNAT superfamily N-acetyltransferase
VPLADVTIHDEPLTRREYQEAAVVAARAFHTDPFFEYMTPNAVARSRGLDLYMLGVCRNLGSEGRLLTARRGGRIVGVAAWIPPGGYPYPVRTQLGQGLGALRGLSRVPSALVTGVRYLVAIEKAHPKEELWYLQLLVTDPEHQRQGIGGSLLEGVLSECDRDGVAAYLETQKQDNVVYYRRFGFELAETLSPVSDGPSLWTMRREPRPAGQAAP